MKFRFTFEAEANDRADFEEIIHGECEDAVGRFIRHGDIENLDGRCALCSLRRSDHATGGAHPFMEA